MSTDLADTPTLHERVVSDLPYPASVVDRFLTWIGQLLVPVWLFYLVLLGALIITFNGLAWLDGSLPFGTFDLYRSSVPVYPVSSLALVHYLNKVARRSLTAFRPALGEQDMNYERFEYELVTMPRRGTRITLALSLILTAAYIRFTPYLIALFRRSPGLAVAESVIYAFAFGMVLVFFYHTIWQLRVVGVIHARATEVNLFRLTPLYAFSGLTAQTGIGLLLMNYFGILTDPATFENLALIALTIGASLIAVVCFVLPLQGMHARIVAEKKRLRAEASTKLEGTIQKLYAGAESQDLANVEQLNYLHQSLVATLDYIEKIPTWPWERGTLLSFISVFLLPFVVRLIVGFAALFLF